MVSLGFGEDIEVNAFGAAVFTLGFVQGAYTTEVFRGAILSIPIGQIDLDMYDPAKKQLVWRGVASKTLDTKAKPEKREKNLRKAAEKLLKNYPPPPKKIKG